MMMWRYPPARPRVPDQFDAIHFRHHPVADQHVERVSSQSRQRRLTVGHCLGAAAKVLRGHDQIFGDKRIIVGHQNAQRQSALRSSRSRRPLGLDIAHHASHTSIESSVEGFVRCEKPR
jgi:hypothetical protein